MRICKVQRTERVVSRPKKEFVKAALSLWFYSTLMKGAKPLLRRKLRRRAKAEALYGQFVEERLGHYTNASQGDWVWVHAVSLGETRTAGILLKGLRENFPGLRLLLTHGTATGREEGHKLLQPGDVQVWQPWDSPDVVARFFKAFQPRLGLILETEIWPNWVRCAQQFKVPLVLVNARMSEKSMRQAMRWPSLMTPAYAGLSAVLAQTKDDAARLQTLGAHVAKVTGNLKFDATPDPMQVSWGQACRANLKQPVLMLASSREGEERLWLQAWQRFVAANPNAHVQWLVVPRHPQRVDDVAQLLAQHGWQVSRRSTWGVEEGHGPPSNTAHPNIFLGDSLGEMALYYSLADVALLGGSFEPLGGQNLIEAAACGCPVVMGPHTFNFAEASLAAVSEGAALRADDMDAAIEKAVALAQDTQARKQHSFNASKFAGQHGGATQRTVLAVREWLIKGSAGH
jgi:3-deoxy-D-manno-octulosonic-acid transferase